jgi:hypothetical protein
VTPRWQVAGRGMARRSWLETWASLHALPLWRRLDAVFFLLLGLVVAGLLLLCTVAVEAADRGGWLNAWTVRPLPDERILTNVRDRLGTNPLLAAVLHGPEQALYAAQAGGTVHRYDPATSLWRTEDPLEGRLLDRDFVQLRSGCGADPQSRAAAACADPASLWAINRTQGLARRTPDGWGVVVGDSSLLGQTGQPLQTEDLTTAAASPDGRWLAVGTRQDGVGLYDTREHRWLPTAEASRQLPSLRVGHLVWWRDRFWAGSTGGLASLTPTEHGVRVESVAGLTGEVIDLDADPDGSLFALLRATCENGPTGCQQLVALDGPGGPIRELVGERRLYPELNLVGLSFAQYAGNGLAVAGQRGVYVYDATRHTWEQIYNGPILATLPLPDGSGFYYAFAGGAGLYQGTDQPRWSVGDERIVRLQHGSGGEALALTERGNVYALPRNADARLAFAGTGSGLAPERLRTGFAVGGTVVLFGPEGALLHDVGRRRYEDVAATSLPEWLKQPGLRFVSASDRLYALLPAGSSTAVYTLDGSRLADGSYYSGDLQQATPLTVPTSLPSAQSPDLRAWVWADQALGLLGDDGSVYRVAGAAVQRVTSLPVRDLERARFLDVTDDNGGLVVATDVGVRRYNAVRREWSEPFRIAGKELVELARLGGRLIGRSTDGTLVQEGGQGVPPGVLIGEGGFVISDAGLSDARQTDAAFYLAGQGRVERYDLATRRVAERWALGGAEPVLIRGLLDGKPLSLSGGQAFLGEQGLDGPAQGVVRSLSTTDRQIVALRELDGHRYLKLYDIANPAAVRCFFRTPTAEGATRVLDARGFADGTVAVSTDAGLRFYSPAMRSWLMGPADVLPRGGRLFVPGGPSGDYLILVDAGVEGGQAEQRLTILPISAIRLPDSCSSEPVTLQGQAESHVARAVAVDEAAGRVAWLTPRGALLEWTAGQPTPREILTAQPDPADGPPLGELRRIYVRQTGQSGTLLATTDRLDRPLWRYDLATRRWTAIQVRFGGSGGPISQIVDLNLEPVGDQEIVLARTDGGNAFLGSFGPGDQAVSLGSLFAAGTPGLGAPGSAILDVQDWSTGRWTFLLRDRIRTYDPITRRWVAETGLPNDPTMQLGQAVGRPVVTAENGRAWLVGTTRGETPPSFVRAELRPDEPTAIDADGTVWRRLPDGELSRCSLAGEAFACRTEIAAPAVVDPASVLQLFEVRPDLLLFVMVDGVRGYNPRMSGWVDLPPEVTGLRGPLTVRQQGSRTFLLSGETLVTLTSEVGGEPQATTQGGVRELVYDDAGLPWIRLDEGWRAWNGTSFAAPVPTTAAPTVSDPPSTTGLVGDSWPTRQTGIAQLPDGRWAYEPVVRFEVDAAGALLAARPSSRIRLADRGTLQIDPVPPLNGGWFRWDRPSLSFMVTTPAGPLAIPRADFVIGDRLLWEVADAILAESSDLIHVASPRGILTYRRSDLLVTDGGTRFQPVVLPAPIEAAHGRFRTPAGDIGISGGAAGQMTPPGGSITFTVGDVTLREEPGPRVVGTVAIGGVNANALTDRGFLWDVDRRGLAYEGGRLLLQSAAGIHPVDGLVGFDAGPHGLGAGGGRLRSEGASGALLDGTTTGAGLWQRAGRPVDFPGQWQQLASDPALDRPFLDDGVWSWRLAGGQVGVALRGDAQAFAAGFGPDGFGFTTDRLVVASAHAGRLHLMTAGLFEIADGPDALAELAGRRLPPSQTDTLEDVRFPDGSTGLFRRAGVAVARLDSASGQFQPVTGAADPYTQLPLVAADRLRLTRRGGQVEKELRLDLPAGGSAWAAFTFVPSGPAGNLRRFPFDVVTALATSGGELYVGTAAGLVVSGGGVGLHEIQALYALGDPSGGASALAAVTRIGQPLADPALVMARSDMACVERRPPTGPGGGGFGPCRDPGLLDTRLRVQNAFWQWSVDASGQVAGAYRDQVGQPAPVALQFTDGRLPHDTLADALVCAGTSYSLWRAGWLTPHAGAGGNGLSLAPPAGSIPPGEATPRQLLCLAQPVAQAGPAAATLPAGLYALADGGRWLQLEQTGWTTVADGGVAAGLEERRAHPPIFERERLRLPPIQPDRGVVFEQRSLDGRWLPLAWGTGPNGDRRLEIDRWTELLQQDGRVWAATPAGLALLGRDANGRIFLDPDRWALIREPLDGDRPCTVTDLEAADGVVRARCDHSSAQVFATQAGAVLDGQRDSGLFAAVAGLPAADPFAERTLVEGETAGRWRWRVTGRRDGQPGTLVGRWFGQPGGQTAGQQSDAVSQSDPGEEIQLVGGRFTFDRLTSVALARAGTVEVGTEAGWIQAPRTRYHALDLRRPDVRNLDPTTFDAVSTTRLEDRTALCLRVTAGGYLRLVEDGARDNPQACPQHLADDDLWRYERGEAPGLLPIRARGGGAIRHLRGGRFTDDLVAGLPVTSQENGRPTYLLPTLAGVVRPACRLLSTCWTQPPLPTWATTASTAWASQTPGVSRCRWRCRKGCNCWPWKTGRSSSCECVGAPAAHAVSAWSRGRRSGRGSSGGCRWTSAAIGRSRTDGAPSGTPRRGSGSRWTVAR